MELLYILLFLLILFILKCNRTEGMDNNFYDNLKEIFDCSSERNTNRRTGGVRPFHCMF